MPQEIPLKIRHCNIRLAHRRPDVEEPVVAARRLIENIRQYVKAFVSDTDLMAVLKGKIGNSPGVLIRCRVNVFHAAHNYHPPLESQTNSQRADVPWVAFVSIIQLTNFLFITGAF